MNVAAYDIGGSYFVPRLAASVAEELLLTGRFIRAERAMRVGLVLEVASDARLEDCARSYVKETEISPLGLRLTKECLKMSLDAPSLEAAIAMEDATRSCAR